jgi:putative membrane protein
MFKTNRFFGRLLESGEEIVLRDYLALERTTLANERTLLAYLRTSLYMLLGGIALLELPEFGNIRWLGFPALGLSVVLFLVGILRYSATRARLIKCYLKGCKV